MVITRGLLRWPALFLICCLIAGQAVIVSPVRASTIGITIDDEQLTTDAAPFIQDGRTLVPFRALFEALGADVAWDSASNTVNITSPDIGTGSGSAAVPGETSGMGETLAPGGTSSGPVSVTDSNGRGVTVAGPVQRIVVCDSQTADAICALGAGDRIVGAPLSLSLANMLNQKIVNSKDVANLTISTPVPEKIIAMRPDVVFLSISQDPLLISKLQSYDIPVAQLDFSRLDALDDSLKVLGQMLGRQERAQQLASFEDKYRDLVADKLADRSPQDKPRVYWEGATDYSVCGKGMPDANIMELAGLTNVNDGTSQPWTTVTPEWVLARDPEAIIRCPDSSGVSSGYSLTVDGMKAHLDDLAKRPAWNRLSAITGGRTYIMSRSLLSGPQAIIGLLYTVKWLHPALFQDVDPEAVHKELLTTFYELDYDGAWVYPAPGTAVPTS